MSGLLFLGIGYSWEGHPFKVSKTLNMKASKLQKVKHMGNISLNVGGTAVKTASNKKMCAYV